jgi:hypothetical protein
VKETFAELLRDFRLRAGRSRHGMCVEACIDPSYGVRLESGEREPPRIGIVEALGRALRLNPGDRNRLLVAAGYVPHSVGTLGWTDALEAVAAVLSDPYLSVEERERFSDVVQSIAERWGNPRPGAREPRLTNGVEAHHV